MSMNELDHAMGIKDAVTVILGGGLGNRIPPLASAIFIARQLHLPVHAYWEPIYPCFPVFGTGLPTSVPINIKFEDLFNTFDCPVAWLDEAPKLVETTDP